MKRLDRFVLVGFFSAWIASTVFYVGLYLVIHFFNKIGDLEQASDAFKARGLTPLAGYARYYGLNIPFILVETAPFTVLMGVMWCLQQMARRGELAPVLVAGVSFRRLAMPLLIAGFLITLGFAVVKDTVLPVIAPKRAEMERLFHGKDVLMVKSLPIITDGQGNVFNVREYDVVSRTAYGVDFIPEGRSASEGVHVGALRFEDAPSRLRGWYPAPESEVRGATRFPLESDLTPRDIEIEGRGLLFHSHEDLVRLVERNPSRDDLRVLLHDHYAYPLTTVILLLLGVPLVLRVGQRSAFVAAGASLLLSLGFYAAQNVMKDLGARGEILNPTLGVWLPLVLFGAVALILYETMST